MKIFYNTIEKEAFDYYYTIVVVSPLLILSKCSLALILSVAIELLLISVEWWLTDMFNAAEPVGTVATDPSVKSVVSFCSLFKIDEEVDDGGDVDATDAGLIGWILLWGGVIDRFWGEVMGIFTLASDTIDDAAMPAIELIGEWRGVSCDGIDKFCGVIAPFECDVGGDRRILAPAICCTIPCGDILKFWWPFGWPMPRFDIPMLDGFRLSGGVK